MVKKTARPKAGDFDEIGKELVLSAANTYRALLASQGAFPNSSTELKLIKKAWKLVNTESGVAPLNLSPSIVTIVSRFILSQTGKSLTVIYLHLDKSSRIATSGGGKNENGPSCRSVIWV